MIYPVGEHLQLAQGSDEWRVARCGSLGASQIADALARTKTGYGASRDNVMSALLVERLTGVPTETFVNDAMRRGTEKEPEARIAYEFDQGGAVEQVGLFLHPTLKGTHASPDGLVEDAGSVEIKCPNTATHIATLLSNTVPSKYIKQMQWQMAATGRLWNDFVSWDDRVPPEMRLFVKRVSRDDAMISEMEREVSAFLAEMEEKIAQLQNRFARAA